MPKPKITEQVVRTDSFYYNVATTGAGAPLVMLHSLGASWQWWLPLMERLADQYRIYAIDLPGAGQSSPILSVPDHSQFLVSIEQLLERLDVADAALVGQSLGGYVGLSYVVAGYRRFRRVAAVCPGGVARLTYKRYALYGIAALSRLPLSAGLYARLVGLGYRGLLDFDDNLRAAMRRSYRRQELRQSLAFQMFNTDKIPRIEELVAQHGYRHAPEQTEIRIFWGERDTVFPYRYAQSLAEMLGGVPVVTFHQSRHWPQLDEPERFQRELVSFFS